MSRRRLLLLGASSGLVALPFLAVDFPPISDLPQQVAQIRLLGEALSNPASPYVVQWFTPYILGYLVLGLSWLVTGPLAAGRVAMLVIGLFWACGIHLLASTRSRSAASAVLATLFLFNHTVYWGFYSFAMGWPIFLWWLALVEPRQEGQLRSREPLRLMAGAVLLYLAHALWFAAAVGWLVLASFLHRLPLRRFALRALALAPVLVAALVWYPHLSARGFRSETVWTSTPLERLNPEWIIEAALGGLRGSAEPVVLAAITGWITLGLWQHRASLRERVDRPLLTAAAFFFLLVLVLPEKFQNTIAFAERWMPPAVVLLLLALPAPAWRPALRTTAALALFAAYSATTTLVWVTFERTELAGLEAALERLPAEPELLGLDFVRESHWIDGTPFLQAFAYGQVLRGGELNFSFADFAPSLVVYSEPREKAWTRGLEWFPQWIRRSDITHFDHALIHGDRLVQRLFTEDPRLRVVSSKGRWWLYRIENDETRP